MEYFIILVVWAAIGGFVGMAIGDLGNKKNGATGFLLGALLGPIGWIIAAVIPAAQSADSPSTTAQPANDHARKISELEAQLQALKKAPAATSKAASKPVYDDGEIPTYKLD